MKWLTILPQVACCLWWVGCGAEPAHPRYAVEGNVTLDGIPLERAQVRFVSIGAGHDAVAPIVEGRFELGNSNGPTAGEHVVLVVPHEPELEQAIQAMQAGDRDPLKSRTVPIQYQSPGTLRATISTGGRNQFRFDLNTR